MKSLILKNGYVFDPLNGIAGERADICIKDGIIVESLEERKAKVIDVSGKTVMPGGIDPHTHVAGGKVNAGRMLRPEDHTRFVSPKGRRTRSGTGFSIPTTFLTGYLYAEMGYTTLFTPAMPPMFAKHTHAEFNDLPMVDKGAFVLCDGNWFIMRYIKNGDLEKCAAYVAWLMEATKAYALKLVNPGGTEAWGWGGDVRSLDDPIPNFEITPKELISGLIEINEYLNLPHSLHLHTINLGRPGNYITALETLRIPRGRGKRRQLLHMTHLQFYCYGGSDWSTICSEAREVAEEVNRSDNVTIDTGSVTLDSTTTMTADGPMEYYLQSLTHLKWTNGNIEVETAMGITPFVYSPKMSASSVQWAIGLELPLLIKDPWKVMITTDHPNAGPFFRYPRLFAWLMSREYRERTLERVHPAAKERTELPSIEREYTLHDIAVATRAAPARALGLEKTKGHLGPGASGDVSVYDINPEEIDGRKYIEIERRFSKAAYTVKGGEVLVKDGEVARERFGNTFWVSPRRDQDYERELLKELDYFFRKFYSFTLTNYPVLSKELRNPVRMNPQV